MNPTRRLLLVACPVAVLAACASAPDPNAPASPADDRVFQAWLRNLDEMMQADPYCKPLPIRGTVATQEYVERVHAAYRKRITPDNLVEWLINRYPGQRYEAEFIAQRLPR